MTKDRLLSLYRVDVVAGKIFRLRGSGGQSAGSEAGWVCNGYVYLTIDRKKYKRSRLVYLAATGDWPIDQIDHIDRDKANDSINNLRDVSCSKNNFNRGTRVDNTSGHVGVSWAAREGRWVSKISNRTLGYFRNIEDAVACRAHYSQKL